VGRDAQAINFRKGCYLGQETVARIDALGHVNKRLCTVRLAGEAMAGDELFAGGESVGRVTSASYSPRFDAWLALAMVRRGHNEPGARLAYRDQFVEVIATPAVPSS
jgi:folate-binding Fe-S cluster repair protein YgfZ